MIDLNQLIDKTIVLKATGFPHAISGTVVNVESVGLWISTQELPSEVSKAGVLIQKAIKNAALFVPFSQLLFLVAAQEEAHQASSQAFEESV